MEVVSLASLIEASTEEGRDVEEYLLSFACRSNERVESFLHNKAIENEQASRTRTSLVIDETNDNEIIGYFSIMVKAFDFLEVSAGVRKKLSGSKTATVFTTILIAQLGRSDTYKCIVPGSEILGIALTNCKTIYKLAALKVVCVEYKDVPFLHQFYAANGFSELQKNDSGFLIGYLRLS
jgi:hypothetical protein